MANVQERGDAQDAPEMCRSLFILTAILWVTHAYYSHLMDVKETHRFALITKLVSWRTRICTQLSSLNCVPIIYSNTGF